MEAGTELDAQEQLEEKPRQSEFLQSAGIDVMKSNHGAI